MRLHRLVIPCLALSAMISLSSPTPMLARQTHGESTAQSKHEPLLAVAVESLPSEGMLGVEFERWTIAAGSESFTDTIWHAPALVAVATGRLAVHVDGRHVSPPLPPQPRQRSQSPSGPVSISDRATAWWRPRALP